MMRRHLSRRLLAQPTWRARPTHHARLSPTLDLVHRRMIHERSTRTLLPCENLHIATGQVKDQAYELDAYGECGPDIDWESVKRRRERKGPNYEPFSDAIVNIAVAVFIVVSTDYIMFDTKLVGDWGATRDGLRLTNSVPSLPDVGEYEGEQGIKVESPGVIMTLEQACKKLREQAVTYAFRGKDKNSQGRVDVVRLASNDPVEDEWYAGQGKGLGGGRAIYAGVFDGHAGWATSRVLKEALVPYVSTALAHLGPESEEHVVNNTIKTAFRNLDERILGTAQATIASSQPGSSQALKAMLPAIAGSCALLTIYDPQSGILRTAVTGDSRAVLGSWAEDSRSYVSEALSEDQTGFNDREVARLSETHPGETKDMLDPKSGRLFGMAITRAFGDHRWKYPLDVLEHMKEKYFDVGPRPKYKTPPYMTAEPEIQTRQVRTKDFVILASDGLWDHMSNEDAVACVSGWLETRRAWRKSSPKDLRYVAPHPTELNEHGSWTSTPKNFVYEDTDSAAVCLVKNAFGGNRRDLFRAVMSQTGPRSRYVRDDITVQVVFFEDPYLNKDRVKEAEAAGWGIGSSWRLRG